MKVPQIRDIDLEKTYLKVKKKVKTGKTTSLKYNSVCACDHAKKNTIKLFAI